MQNVSYIDSDDELAQRCEQLQGVARIALDTEFIRERTYFPGICLVQLAAGDDVLLIDPLAVKRLEPLYALLAAPSITKVLHAARQDFEIFFHLTGRLPAPLFDTQVAAALVGYPEQVGYATLVEAILGVTLDKSHTRTNWQRRPLSDAQLAYAADDVRYLGPVCDHLVERLADSGRTDWAREDNISLKDPKLYEGHPEDAWRRIKAARHLKGRQGAALKSLAAWRERWAIARDKPRQWMIRDEVLVAIARSAPDSANALADIPGVTDKMVSRHADTILEAVATGGEPVPDTDPRRGGKPDARETELYKQLQTLVDERASQLDLPSSVLAPRRDLRRAAAGDSDLSMFTGWRRSAVGDDVTRLVTGANPGDDVT